MKIDLDLIKINQHFETKKEAITYCGNLFVDNKYTTLGYVDDMLERDQQTSVYIGNDIAIPHGLASSNDKILKTGICIVQVPNGVKFESGVARMLIGIAAKNDEQLEILSTIANICIDMGVVEQLISADSEIDIVKILNIGE